MNAILVLCLSWGFAAGAITSESFRVAEFLEPLHPQSPRNASWPASITIEDLKLQSVTEFLQTRNGRWRVVYACAGEPVSDQYLVENNMADGWVNSRFETQYAGLHWQGFDLIRPPHGKPGDPNSTIRARPIKTDVVEMLGDGAFTSQTEGDPVHTIRFGRVKETGESVLFSEPLTNFPPCNGVDFLRAIIVPVEVPIS